MAWNKTPRHRKAESELQSQYDLASSEQLLSYAEEKGVNISPLDIASLASLLDVDLIYVPMEDHKSGSLHRKKSKWVMKVNSLQHPHRQRFTIAHELAHRVLHVGISDTFEDEVFFRDGASNHIEHEANQFAAELLMPAGRFRLAIKEYNGDIDQIAESFFVSTMAVRVRAKSLGYRGHGL